MVNAANTQRHLRQQKMNASHRQQMVNTQRHLRQQMVNAFAPRPGLMVYDDSHTLVGGAVQSTFMALQNSSA